jgi:hypothetical protein
MLRDLAIALQLQNSNRAAREKLALPHIYVNRRARSSAVNRIALAPRGWPLLSAERAERFVRHNRAVYGIVRRLL